MFNLIREKTGKLVSGDIGNVNKMAAMHQEDDG